MVRILAGLMLGIAACGALADAPRIEDAWLREPAPGQGALAIYFRVVNADGPARVLAGARVEGASSAAVHTHEVRDGMMSMRPAGPLDLPAGGELRLEPGGLHLMVFGVDPPPRADQRLGFCVHFADGAASCGEATVRGPGE